MTGGGGTVGNALVDHPDIALITFTGSPEVGWGIRARAPRKKVGLELGNNAPVIIEPDGDWRDRGRQDQGRRVQPRRPVVHLDAADLRARVDRRRLHRPSWSSGSRALVVGDPLDEATDVSALISHGRARAGRVVDRRGRRPAGAKVATGGEVERDGVLAPTVLTDVTPDMKVCRQEVFGPVVARRRPTTTSTTRSRLANDTALRAAGRDLHRRPRQGAARRPATLDFGGVLVNEVPTWRADQKPYGGVRDSGNTREGPHYAVREMTETRLVVISA